MTAPLAATTVDDALAAARAAGVDRLDAQLLLSLILDRPRSWLLAHGDAAMPAEAASRYPSLLNRRAAGEPLAYLTGEREFHGLSLQVTSAVLVPRPDTETLVDWALELLTPPGPLGALPAPQVIDLGTGSGAIALALKQRCPRANVCGLDASAPALAVAGANATRLGLAVEFRSGDWLDGLPHAAFDCIVSNPPYIAEDDPHWPGLRHEPRAALASGADGLRDLRRIVEAAPRHLRPGGWLLLEHGATQGPAVAALLTQGAWVDLGQRQDLAGHTRCTGARRAP